jgi:hypothetical protein
MHISNNLAIQSLQSICTSQSRSSPSRPKHTICL